MKNQLNIPMEKQKPQPKKPNESSGVLIGAHIKIKDVKTGEVLLKTRG